MRFWKSLKVHGKARVGVGVAAFLETTRDQAALRCLVASFQAQTYDRWRLLVVHDGPASDTAARCLAELATDPRVETYITPERKKQFGHPHRQAAIDRLTSTCDWVGLTNQDNYYAPVYLEWMLAVGTNPKRPREFIYCDCVHSHKQWRPLVTEPRSGRLDLGGWLASAALARQVRFDKFAFNGDGDYINKLRQRAKGIEKVPAVLFVHN